MKEDNDNFVELLERLAKLKSDGLITEQEFEEGKKRILYNIKTSNNEEITNEINTALREDDFDESGDILEEIVQRYGRDNKISIIAALREETGLGLKEAKDIVEYYLN